MLEIDPMADWLVIVSALLGGGAAGVLFYIVGRRVERRTAEATARAVAAEGARLLEDARQRVVALEQRDRGLDGRARILEERERALGAKELEARARLEQIAGLTALEAKQ